MKLKRIMQTVTLLLLMTIMIIAFSCKKNEDSTDSASARKTAPVAIAGNDHHFFCQITVPSWMGGHPWTWKTIYQLITGEKFPGHLPSIL